MAAGLGGRSVMQALEWAERHLTHDEIEAAFGKKLQDA
jgi:hypothetical protein